MERERKAQPAGSTQTAAANAPSPASKPGSAANDRSRRYHHGTPAGAGRSGPARRLVVNDNDDQAADHLPQTVHQRAVSSTSSASTSTVHSAGGTAITSPGASSRSSQNVRSLSRNVHKFQQFINVPDGDFKPMLTALAQVAEPEPWGHHLRALRVYLVELVLLIQSKYAKASQAAQDRFSANSRLITFVSLPAPSTKRLMLFQTGLTTPKNELIIACFSNSDAAVGPAASHAAAGGQAGVDVEDGRLYALEQFNTWPLLKQQFPILQESNVPEQLRFATRPKDRTFDVSLPVKLDPDRLWARGREVLPAALQVDREQTEKLILQEIELVKKQCLLQRNYAVPHIEKGWTGFLLPMYLNRGSQQAAAAAGVSIEEKHSAQNVSTSSGPPCCVLCVYAQKGSRDSGPYFKASLLLSLSDAYNRARLVERPNVAWLPPPAASNA